MNDVAEWEAIHKSRMWGTYPDIHVVRQVKKFMAHHAEQMKHVPFRVIPMALDIGCGVGACSEMMNGEGLLVTAIDGSETAVRNMQNRGSDISVYVADAQEMEFPPMHFDFILDNLSLTYLEHPPWNRIMSWLKPSGWLIHASFEEAPRGTPKAWHHLSPGNVVERHSSWVEGNAFSFVVRKYVKPS
jgi:2-polyprenyl-3-methyl-5-hydroxy-6-metoxy-1,4-benzoquinol methylase